MFESVINLFAKKAPVEPEHIGNGTTPDDVVRCGYRAWVVLEDGRVGYIDHYKSDGRFGVRPVDKNTGLHYPNISAHWTMEQRLKVPEELALSFGQMRAATDDEMPMMYRRNAA